MLLFDDLRITSIIQNLVMNAVKFSRMGGFIKIEASLDPESGEVLLSVADTGCGMTDEVKESLFTMFSSITKKALDLDSKSKVGNNRSGVGLGLTFCKSMIVRLGGDIRFDSVLKLGSTFYIKFPVKVATAEELEGTFIREKSVETVLIGKLQRLQ